MSWSNSVDLKEFVFELSCKCANKVGRTFIDLVVKLWICILYQATIVVMMFTHMRLIMIPFKWFLQLNRLSII